MSFTVVAMTNAKIKLRLGPIPKTNAVRLTISLTTALKTELERYASLHAQTYGEAVDAAALIPHMLEAFVARDRGFKSLLKSPKSVRGVPLGSTPDQ